LGRIMRLAESFYGQTSTRQKSGARGLCVYDLILLDLNLPDMNGHEVLRQLRLARIDTPILILSGSDDTESKIKGFGFGADDYLTKPFHREELIACSDKSGPTSRRFGALVIGLIIV